MAKYGALVIVGVVVGLLLGGKVATENLGGVYSTTEMNFPSLVVKNPSANATTSIVVGKVCYTVTESDGGTVYWYAKADGNFGTTTSSGCVQ